MNLVKELTQETAESVCELGLTLLPQKSRRWRDGVRSHLCSYTMDFRPFHFRITGVLFVAQTEQTGVCLYLFLNRKAHYASQAALVGEYQHPICGKSTANQA